MITLRRSGLIKVALGQTTWKRFARNGFVELRVSDGWNTLSELLEEDDRDVAATPHYDEHALRACASHGRPPAAGMPPLTAADTKSLAYSVLTDAQSTASKRPGTGLLLGLKNLARFRGNVFNQRGAVAPFSVRFLGNQGFDALDCRWS